MEARRHKWAALMLTMLASGCSPHAASPPGPTKTPPRRIVSLAPNVTEILFALGLGDRVVGVTTEDDYPPEAARKQKIGDAFTNVEKVLSLKPELVIGHSFLNARAIASLKKLGVNTLGVEAKDLRSVGDSVVLIARSCGVPAQGEALRGRMEREIAEVRTTYAKTNERPVVLFAAQANPIWAAGGQTFVNEMITLAGGINAAEKAGAQFSVMSEEAAVARNPDIVLVTDDTTRRYFVRARAWAGVRAVRSSRVIQVDPDLYLRPGPRLARGLSELAVLLHLPGERGE